MYWYRNNPKQLCRPSEELQKVLDRRDCIQSVYQDSEGGLAISTDKPCDDDYVVELLQDYEYQGERFIDDLVYGEGVNPWDTDEEGTTFYLVPNQVFNLIKK